MQTIRTKVYGEIEIDAQQVMEFPVGLFGFEHRHRYALMDSRTPPFYWLQSLDDEGLAFVLINPYVAVNEYLLDIDPADLAAIGAPDPEDLLVFAVVTIPAERHLISCNLQGPLVINRRTRVGRQVISLDQRWSTRHYLLPGAS